MAYSFEIVEDKLYEADFFLDKFRMSSCLTTEARFYFSAFVSAARSATFTLQKSLGSNGNFKPWYEIAVKQLKTDPLATCFVEIRNEIIHQGINPINKVTCEHLREHMARQLQCSDRSHILILPNPRNSDDTVLLDASRACILYFNSLVELVFDCYGQFKCTVDPRWYFTKDNFDSLNKTFSDALVECGFPPEWASSMPAEADAWRVLRSQQPGCQLNELFERCLGRQIPGPDDCDT